MRIFLVFAPRFIAFFLQFLLFSSLLTRTNRFKCFMANGQKFIAGNLQMYPRRRGREKGAWKSRRQHRDLKWLPLLVESGQKQQQQPEKRMRGKSHMNHACDTSSTKWRFRRPYAVCVPAQFPAWPRLPCPAAHTVLFRNQSQCHKSQRQSKICFPTVNCDCGPEQSRGATHRKRKYPIDYTGQGSLSIAVGSHGDLGSLLLLHWSIVCLVNVIPCSHINSAESVVSRSKHSSSTFYRSCNSHFKML